jgi:hypothetical protein
MTVRRSAPPILAAILAVVVLACGGAGSSPASPPSPDPSFGGPVATEADAVARVVAHEPRFAGVRARDPALIGQAAWYEVVPASGVGAFVVTMRIGWGDCPSGCIEEHSWTYAVLPDGEVRLQSEGGSAVPPDAWPAPSATAGGAIDTGLHIRAVAGPTCPVERVPPDPGCAPRPVSNAVVTIVDDAGVEAARVVLDATGQAVVDVEPGVYTVNGQGVTGLMGGPEPQSVEVTDGAVAEVVVAYDTGIR